MPRQYQQQQNLENELSEFSIENDSAHLFTPSQENDGNPMDVDNSMDVDEELESTSESEDEEKERETSLSTYLGKRQRQFVPYEFNEESNTVDLVIDAKEQNKGAIEPVLWFSSSRIKGLKLVNEDYKSAMENIAPFYNKQFWTESAVAGGRCSRLLLGKVQPKMHVCLGKASSRLAAGARTYRLSKEIKDFVTWESISINGYQELNGKPIVGLTAVFLVNYLLANVDMNEANYGLVEFEDYWHAASIDPECCFSHHFYTDIKEDISNFIQQLPNYVPNQLFNKLELFTTLEKIIATPLSAYSEIFDASFSKRHRPQKELYMSTMAKRLQLFTEVAYSIEGFREYVAYQEEQRGQHYKKLENDFNDSRMQQSENQQFLQQFCDFRPQPQSFWGNNRFGFYNNTARAEPETEQFVPAYQYK